MEKEKLTGQFISAIKKVETELVYNVKVDEFNTEDDYLYCELSYQIKDSVYRNSDEYIATLIEEELGGEYGVVVFRMDAFSNGLASYKVKIDK